MPGGDPLFAAIRGKASALARTPSQRRVDLEQEEQEPSSPIQRREFSVAIQGWLTKHSKSGLPNWNRRWFVLVGGTLFYARNPERAENAGQGEYVVFAELLSATRVELAELSGFSYAFRLVTPTEQLSFAAPSRDARLEWVSALEAHLGMQPVGQPVLTAALRRWKERQTKDVSARNKLLRQELAEAEALLHAAAEREAGLHQQLEAMRLALADKDASLFRLAQHCTTHLPEELRPTPAAVAAAPPDGPLERIGKVLKRRGSGRPEDLAGPAAAATAAAAAAAAAVPTPVRVGRRPSATPNVPGARTMSATPAATPMRAAGGAPVHVELRGWLTKLSKGGFTANWNRRAFALIGSTLVYAKNHETLIATPKVFAEVLGCDVRQWEEERVEGKANVFAVRLHSVDDPTPQHDEVLLLAADSRRDKFAWIDAIHRARELPPCSLDRVITMLARERVGGIDPNILGVLHGDPTQDGSHHGAHLAARYTEPSEASEATAASRRPQRSSQPDSAGGLVERWMPGFVKNL